MAIRTNPDSVWHDGEKALQREVGVADKMEIFGTSFIRNYMPEQLQEFFRHLPFAVFGVVDETGDAWATILSARPGFLHSSSETLLEVRGAPHETDPSASGFALGGGIGVLGIELQTRRRNRINGVINRRDAAGFSIEVEHAFGNCPKFIQKRACKLIDEAEQTPQIAIETGSVDKEARALIESADTFFVASYVDALGGRQVDVSHRGGRKGFVRIDNDGVLTIPDYAGNRYFNTLGNLVANPRAGLLFPDFDSGDVLQMSGKAEVILKSAEIADHDGAERLWKFRPERTVRRHRALPFRWSLLEWSPHTLRIGAR